jgi:hypothetical protein
MSLEMTVGQSQSIGTETGFPISNFPIVFVNPAPLLCISKIGGLYILTTGADPNTPSLVMILPSPTLVGDSAVYYGHVIRTTSLRDSIVVPAGSFSCVRYDVLQSDTLRGRIYVSPEIGIIKCWQRYYGVAALVDELRTYQLH